MQVYKLSTDEFGRELTQHGSIDFPCAGYDESFSKFLLGEVPWHWHEELEIVVVYEGSTRVEYIGGDMQVSVGEGILINSRITSYNVCYTKLLRIDRSAGLESAENSVFYIQFHRFGSICALYWN